MLILPRWECYACVHPAVSIERRKKGAGTKIRWTRPGDHFSTSISLTVRPLPFPPDVFRSAWATKRLPDLFGGSKGTASLAVVVDFSWPFALLFTFHTRSFALSGGTFSSTTRSFRSSSGARFCSFFYVQNPTEPSRQSKQWEVVVVVVFCDASPCSALYLLWFGGKSNFINSWKITNISVWPFCSIMLD